MKKRIVVTGLGIVSSLGIGTEKNWKNYIQGISGIREHELVNGKVTTYAGKVSDSELESFIPLSKKGKIDRFAVFALVAARMALDDARFDEGLDRDKIGVFIGSAFSGLNIIEKQLNTLYADGPKRVHPFLMQNNLTNAPAGEVAIEMALKGPNIGISNGGCSGDYCIIHAFNTMQQHDIQAMVVGGTEAPLLTGVFEELKTSGLLQEKGRHANHASCPFDRERNGFVISEGAGFIILETLQSAEKRGANIYGELTGFGNSFFSEYFCNQKGTSFDSKILCIEQALKSASLNPYEIDYINASGISGINEDREETEAIKTVFGKKTPLSSIKGSLGFSVGAAGVVDIIYCLLSLKNKLLPQTNNLEHIDPRCNTVRHLKTPEEKTARFILSNNFDYTGKNVSLIFSRLT